MTEFEIPEQIDDLRKYYEKHKAQLVQVNITTGIEIKLGTLKQDLDELANILTPKQEVKYLIGYDKSLSPNKKMIKVIVE